VCNYIFNLEGDIPNITILFDGLILDIDSQASTQQLLLLIAFSICGCFSYMYIQITSAARFFMQKSPLLMRLRSLHVLRAGINFAA